MSQKTGCGVIGCDGEIETPEDWEITFADLGRHFHCDKCKRTYRLAASGSFSDPIFELESWA